MADDFTDHQYVMEELQKAQDADSDNRDKARDAHLFIDKRDGQWEPYWWDLNKDRPRYTFDLTTPIINQITGKLAKADFAGDVEPMGGEATKEIAKTYDGIVRNIQVISNANYAYNSSGRSMVTSGIDGWQVVQKFIDGDSFDQDLIIENIENFVDRVWFNAGAERQDRADATMGWKFTGFSPEKYKEKWPNGGADSLRSNKVANAYFNKPELIMVGEFYYIEEVERELVLMTNNAVYEDNDDFKKIKDELAQVGVTEVRRRKRKTNKVFTRKMDATDWLEEVEETVFDFIPLIPTYGNYKIFEGKTLYRGAVEKLLDPQRVFNYSLSREIEEGALAPRAKYWMTNKQVEGNMSTLATMNTNADPIQIYNHDPDVPGPPQQNGGAMINPGLRSISESASSLISQSAGLFAANLGDNPNAQSGVAIDSLKEQGDVGTIEYFASQEIAICHTLRILIKAIPKVYVGNRQVRILNEDGSFKMVNLNETIIDEETQEEIVINDLSIGTYDVTCSAGPSFQNRQQETVSAMVEIGGVDPSVITLGADILLNNVTAPGMDMIAERKRQELFQAGAIPPSQWSDEEKAQVQQAQEQAQLNPPAPDPLMVAAQAEQGKAQAALVKAFNEQAKIMIAATKEDREDQKDQFEAFMAVQQQQMDKVTTLVEYLNTNADTMKKIREASGADQILGPGILQNFKEQSDIVSENQEAL